jgi:hypothetical protein
MIRLYFQCPYPLGLAYTDTFIIQDVTGMVKNDNIKLDVEPLPEPGTPHILLLKNITKENMCLYFVHHLYCSGDEPESQLPSLSKKYHSVQLVSHLDITFSVKCIT